MTVYSIRSRWSRPSKHFTILTDGSRRTAAGWTYLKKQIGNLSRRNLGHRGPGRVDLKQYLKTIFFTTYGTQKKTYSRTPRGGFFDAWLQNREPEPPAKTFQDSDRRGPPNSRGMDVPDPPPVGTSPACAANPNLGRKMNLFQNSPRPRRRSRRGRAACPPLGAGRLRGGEKNCHFGASGSPKKAIPYYV